MVLLGFIALLSAVILRTTFFELDPFGNQSGIAFMSLFVSLFLLTFAVVTMLYVGVRWVINPSTTTPRILPLALRRGVLAGIFLCAVAVMQLLRVLGIMEIVLVGLFIALLEYAIGSDSVVDEDGMSDVEKEDDNNNNKTDEKNEPQKRALIYGIKNVMQEVREMITKKDE